MQKALTVNEACAMLGLSKPTALKLLRNGTLPAARLGKSWRLSEQMIEKMLRGEGSGGQSKPEEKKAA